MNLDLFALLISLYTLSGWPILVASIYQNYWRQKSFSPTPWLWPWGIFVWGDGLILSLYWIGASLAWFITGNQEIFLVFGGVFWLVRSGGEVIYWLIEQFATKKRNKPSDLWGHQFFAGESIYFAYQIFWQVVMMVSIIGLIFLLR